MVRLATAERKPVTERLNVRAEFTSQLLSRLQLKQALCKQ